MSAEIPRRYIDGDVDGCVDLDDDMELTDAGLHGSRHRHYSSPSLLSARRERLDYDEAGTSLLGARAGSGCRIQYWPETEGSSVYRTAADSSVLNRLHASQSRLAVKRRHSNAFAPPRNPSPAARLQSRTLRLLQLLNLPTGTSLVSYCFPYHLV